MHLTEATTGGVLKIVMFIKKGVLKILPFTQENTCFPFKNTYFEEHLRTTAYDLNQGFHPECLLGNS